MKERHKRCTSSFCLKKSGSEVVRIDCSLTLVPELTQLPFLGQARIRSSIHVRVQSAVTEVQQGEKNTTQLN